MEPALITLDTSAIFALLNRRDPDHDSVRHAFEADGGPYLVPAGILAEVGYWSSGASGSRCSTRFWPTSSSTPSGSSRPPRISPGSGG